jgi:hypothetical protein
MITYALELSPKDGMYEDVERTSGADTYTPQS